MHVAQAPNGQWFMLNNHVLFVCNEATQEDAEWQPALGFLACSPRKGHNSPFGDAVDEFRWKFALNDNGNTCQKRGSNAKHWVCAELVGREFCKTFIENVPSASVCEKKTQKKCAWKKIPAS